MVLNNCLAALGVICLAVATAGKPAHADSVPLTVVELFTSQGCGDCPPADAALGKLAERADILALSFHISYWDHRGWRDPFAAQFCVQRQWRYARQFDHKFIYTPQFVVDGIAEVSSGDTAAMDSVITQRRERRRWLPVQIERNGDDGLSVEVAAGESNGPSDIWFIVYEKRHRTKVDAGENAGRTLTNHNVVRTLQNMGPWNGEAMQLDLPRPADSLQAPIGVAVLVQTRSMGLVLGAARMEIGGAS
ncbi:MAG: DUF1223 domain-containing protein [Alphaproteobacteria bacterium]|nr:DUF1223 domain-containing protein [Alphaproteobacteria bacterium]